MPVLGALYERAASRCAVIASLSVWSGLTMGKQDHLSAGKSTSKAAQTANIRKIYRRPPPLTTTKCSASFIFLRQHIIWKASGTACPYNLFTIASANVWGRQEPPRI